MKRATRIICAVTIFLLIIVDNAFSWQIVLCEHVAYNQLFFDEADQGYMLVGVAIDDGPDNLRVEWTDGDGIGHLANVDDCDNVYCNLQDCDIDACAKVLGSVDQASVTDWHDIGFYFYHNDDLLRVLNNGTDYSFLDSPVAVADYHSKTIFWKPVSNATFYFIRITDGPDIDADVIFQSEALTENYYTFPESAYGILLGNSVYVEARETNNGEITGRPVNSSIFVTKFLLNGDYDGDGSVGLSDAVNALKVVSGH